MRHRRPGGAISFVFGVSLSSPVGHIGGNLPFGAQRSAIASLAMFPVPVWLVAGARAIHPGGARGGGLR